MLSHRCPDCLSCLKRWFIVAKRFYESRWDSPRPRSPNGWMDQDATWYGCRPRPSRHCVIWGPSFSQNKRGTAASQFRPMFVVQTAGWIKMPLGREVDLGLGDIVLDEDPAPPRGHSPRFSARVVAKRWMDQDTTWYWGRPRLRPHCVRWGPSPPKGAQQPVPLFGPCLLCPNGRPSQLLLSTCYMSDVLARMQPTASNGTRRTDPNRRKAPLDLILTRFTKFDVLFLQEWTRYYPVTFFSFAVTFACFVKTYR